MNPHQNAACASIAGGLRASRTLGFDHGNVDTHFSTIQSEFRRRGILQMTAAEYFDLVDKSGRMMRSGKRRAIDADLAPILLRIGTNTGAIDSWPRTLWPDPAMGKECANILYPAPS
jgi:hypothetical protein